MIVFSSYFKVLRSKLSELLIYMGIFCGVMIIFMNVGSGQNTDSYEENECRYAIADEDGSSVSRAFASYLADTQTMVELDVYDDRAVQDALYYRDVDCVITIPEGFGDALISGEAAEMLDIVTIQGSQNSMLLESRVNSYLNMMSLYLGNGSDAEAADESARAALAVRADVSLIGGSSTGGHSSVYTFYSYLGWLMIVVMTVGLTPVLLSYNRKALRDRISCSSYGSARVGMELVLALIVTAFILCAVFELLAVSLTGRDGQSLKMINGVLFAANMLAYVCVALAVAFFVSRFAGSEEVVSMCANIVSLGMAFLCGIFVPMEYLGDKVKTAAHFLPAYWYSEACSMIDYYDGGSLSGIVSCMGIELLFAATLIAAAMAIDK